ncbi:MAG: hypothetical protein IJ111_14700 [Eggerthellaceae bacterium]|nr:hypothetical protein [Eggerthellaceae bacterium]
MSIIGKKLGALVCALALACGVLAGCANSAATTATAEQQANRAYMSQVNGIMEELGEGLDTFVDAVSRNDIVNMRTQADNAYKALDELKDLEVPDELADVQEKYVKGADKLREALDGYIALYTEMNSESFDMSTYDARIDAVQSLYDEGVDLMAEADETAASKS